MIPSATSLHALPDTPRELVTPALRELFEVFEGAKKP